MESRYRVVIANGTKRLELESDNREWLEKEKVRISKELKLFDAEPSPGASKVGLSQEASNEPPQLGKLTVNEFYKKYCTGVKSNPDKAVFLIYFLNWVENKKRVTTDEVRELFIRVGIPKANKLNLADVLSKAKKRALLNYIDKGWSLTITGEDFVVNKIQGKPSE